MRAWRSAGNCCAVCRPQNSRGSHLRRSPVTLRRRMTEPRQRVATRIAQLELREEQRVVKEGYELLDEKRIRLVAEIRVQLEHLRHWQSEVGTARDRARSALIAALGRHGMDELSVYPAASAGDDKLEFARSRLFGLELLEVQWQAGAAHPP